MASRDQTSAQLERLLRRRGVDPETIGAALEELRCQGALDDERYARNFIHDRRELDGWGSERIRDRLEAVGVERDVIDAALARDREGELEAAVALLERRLIEPPANDAQRARALGLLLRRGYESELAYEAVRQFGDGTTEPIGWYVAGGRWQDDDGHEEDDHLHRAGRRHCARAPGSCRGHYQGRVDPPGPRRCDWGALRVKPRARGVFNGPADLSARVDEHLTESRFGES